MLEISVEDYRKALQEIEIGDLQQKILNILYWSPTHSATAKIVADFLKMPSYAPINLQYGKLGHKIAQNLRIETQVPLSNSRGRPQWWYVLSKGQGNEQGFWWTLWPNLVMALEMTNIVEEFKQADELTLLAPIQEGKMSNIKVNRYERDPLARRLCIEKYGTRCAVCRFELGEIYGEIGVGYIHVHHLIPLSSIRKEYEVDPVKDLRPVCPNCHVMLHRKDPPYTIEELTEILRKSQYKKYL